MGFTKASQSSLSINADQIWRLVEIAVIPAAELNFVTSTATPSTDSAPATFLVKGLPVAARKRCRSQSHGPVNQHSIIQPSVAQQTAHRGFTVGAAERLRSVMGQAGSSLAATCRPLELHQRKLILGADAGQGPLLGLMRTLQDVLAFGCDGVGSGLAGFGRKAVGADT
jgi:hypothetical protein